MAKAVRAVNYEIRVESWAWAPPEPIQTLLSPNEEVLLLEPRGEWMYVYIGKRNG